MAVAAAWRALWQCRNKRVLLRRRQRQFFAELRNHRLATACALSGCRVRGRRRLHRRRRPEAQRLAGHPQRLLAPAGKNFDARRHARQQHLIPVRRRDDDGVGDDALLADAAHAHLRNFAAKLALRMAGDGESDALALLDGSDIGFVDLGRDLNLRQILRDLEQFRRLQARRYRLPDIDRA